MSIYTITLKRELLNGREAGDSSDDGHTNRLGGSKSGASSPGAGKSDKPTGSSSFSNKEEGRIRQVFSYIEICLAFPIIS